MERIQIRDYSNIYYIEDDEIQRFLSPMTDKKNIPKVDKKDNPLFWIDLKSDKYKEENKRKAIKSFTLLVRVSRMLEKKQIYKKKLYKFTDKTILQALTELSNEPDKLKSQILSQKEQQEQLKVQKEHESRREQERQINKVLDDVWDDFYKYKTTGAGKKWRDSTANNYKSFYNVWIRNTDMGLTPVKELSKATCKNLIDEVAEIRAMRTATTVIEILRPMMDWYLDEHEIDKRNPVPSKKDYPFNNVRAIDIELSEITKIYKAMDEDKYADLFKWLRTGRRRGEIAGLMVEHIDFKGSSFLVTAETNKAATDMEYKLRDELRETIKTDKGRVFDMNKDTMSKQFKKVLEDVEGTFKLRGKRQPLKELHLHDIRHLISSVLKKASVPEEIRGKVLGHKRTSITDRYGADYFEDIDKAYQLFLDIVYGIKHEDTRWGEL